MTDLEGYEPDDPKSPGWLDRITERADDQRNLPRVGTLPHELEGDR